MRGACVFVGVVLLGACADGERAVRGPDAASIDAASAPPIDAYVPPGVDGYVVPIDARVTPIDAGQPVDAFVAPIDAGRDAPAPRIVRAVNELQAQGDEFVELVNGGTEPWSLAGHEVADSDGLSGDPTHVTPLPAGLILAPGEHFVIAMDEPSPASGIVTSASACRGAPRCVQTGYGLSNTGDTFALLDGSGAEVLRVDFPGLTATGISSVDQTYCRFPDAEGAFTVCSSTPGAPNAPP